MFKFYDPLRIVGRRTRCVVLQVSLPLSLSLCCCSSCVVQAVQVVLVVSGLIINLAWLCFLWQHHHHLIIVFAGAK